MKEFGSRWRGAVSKLLLPNNLSAMWLTFARRIPCTGYVTLSILWQYPANQFQLHYHGLRDILSTWGICVGVNCLTSRIWRLWRQIVNMWPDSFKTTYVLNDRYFVGERVLL
jgi:hypothetical protein